jgi:serine/threonine-protein kinase
MAAVHLGTMVGPAGERRVAIKRLPAENAIDDRARQRLVEEARLVFRLTHANICQVFDVATSADGAFVVMEFVEGLDLRALVKRVGPLELPHALYIAREVARALDYAHRRCDEVGRPLLLVHGDVTPANVLVSCEGEVKLADFGICRALGGVPASSFAVAGTPGFVAPEVKQSRTSQRADLYALGVTLYVALTGKLPADRARLPALRSVRPTASADLEHLLTRVTDPDPDARTASAAQLEQALALELARRFAEFTPSSLARVVRAHYVAAASERALSEDSVLASMTIPFGDRLPGEDIRVGEQVPPHAIDEGTPAGTRTAPPPRSRSRALLAMSSLLVAAGGWGAYKLWFDDRDSPPAAAPETPAAVAAAPTAPASTAQAPTADPPPTPPSAAPAPAQDPPPPPSQPAPVVVRAADPRPPPKPARARAERRAVADPQPAKLGYLTVTARSWGAVFVDGHQVAAQTPLYKLALASGLHRVKIFQPATGAYSGEQDVEIRPDQIAQVSFK